ncbi:hypothetical protein Rhopal_007430-T1 [Rhodotorula paludigena]|uniref:RRM domain-containing protein n=1 Tax=Rhodotorula paludigena TaxID=86838 RepID=A0AAV5GPQ1_9BASI|nr:hypothetical protein Rhopal_007430-T1 [Rhodotorula paludigena]
MSASNGPAGASGASGAQANSTSAPAQPAAHASAPHQPQSNEPAPEPYFDRQLGKWCCEDRDGNELEWDAARNAWVPAITEDVLKAQQAAYSVEGVDESAPAAPNKEDRKGKKRKAGDNGDKPAKKPRANTAVFVSKLPDSTTVDQLVSTFSKAGLILEDVNGDPKVKLYKDDAGRFKGEALIVYLQEASVELACRLFDETELELGSGAGTMSVKVAQWDNSSKDKEKEKVVGEGDKGEGTSSGNGASKKGKTDQEKARLGKKAAALRQKLGDWSDDEDPAAAAARARKYRGVVVLEGMFTLKELEEDPTLLLDLKEDVREECETIGEVTNVTLYDKEDKGVMTVRFKEELAAQACIAKMNGRYFGGRTIAAFPMDGTKKYKKSGQGVDLRGTGFGDDDEDEQAAKREEERLEKYADWLEKGGE